MEESVEFIEFVVVLVTITPKLQINGYVLNMSKQD